MSITPAKAYKAALALGDARDDLLAFYHAGEITRLGFAISYVRHAAKALGYTLTPLKEAPHVADTQDQPDSGRLNLSNESPAPFSENYGA